MTGCCYKRCTKVPCGCIKVVKGPQGPPGQDAPNAADLYARIRNATVSLFLRIPGGPAVVCSGFIISKDGIIVSCAHCIIDDSDPENIRFRTEIFALITHVNGTAENRAYKCKILGYDGAADISVLKADPSDPYNALNPPLTNQSILEFGSNRSKRAGDRCFVIGDPRGLDVQSIAEGVIRDPVWCTPSTFGVVEYVDTTAAIYGGNSGGPVVDENGRVIAQTSFVVVNTDGGRTENFNGGAAQFILEPVVNAIISAPNPHVDLTSNPPRYIKGFLGWRASPVNLGTLTTAPGLREVKGYSIISVIPGGPADTATPFPIKALDVILSVDGVQVGLLPGYVPPTSVTWFKLPGDKVTIRFLQFLSLAAGFVERTTILTLGVYPLNLDLQVRPPFSSNPENDTSCCQSARLTFEELLKLKQKENPNAIENEVPKNVPEPIIKAIPKNIPKAIPKNIPKAIPKAAPKAIHKLPIKIKIKK